jgi:hypothetical protein
MANFRFRVEMRVGQDQRVIEADSFTSDDQWMIFYRNPPQGGKVEYWRVRMDVVASMETQRAE